MVMALSSWHQCVNGLKHEGLPGLSPRRHQALITKFNNIWTGERNGSRGSMYLPNPENGTACWEALNGTHAIGLTTRAKMVDAWGKFPDGYQFGNMYPWGQYDQCLRIWDDTAKSKGKYCLVYYRRHRHYSESQPRLVPSDFIEADVPHNMSLIDIPGISMQYGTCMPHQCTQQQLNDSIISALSGTDKYLYSLHCYDPDGIPYDGVDIGFIVFCGVIWLLMIGGAIAEEYIDRTNQTNLRNGPLRFVIPFSVTTNMRKLFTINPNPKGAITAIYGMRFLSMCWVIYGHMQFYGTTLNGAEEDELTEPFLFQIIRYANVVTDTFFFMGGMLVAYGLLRELERTGKFNIIMYYVHRLVRLSPAIAVVSWYYASVNIHVIHGPGQYYIASKRESCQKYWWRDTFHVTNVGESVYRMCNGQLWYTTVDTQIYLVGPLMILPLYYFKKGAGKLWLYALTIGSMIIPAAIIYENDLAPGHYDNPKDHSYSYLIYRKPWSRASAWIVGIWAGYVLNKMSHKKLILKKWMVVAGWTVCFITLFLVQFGLYSYAQEHPKAQYDVMTQIFYGGMHRAAWAACLAWIVIACTAGYGGIINEFLSYPGWQPLSRLSFPMYLIAMNAQSSFTKAYRIPGYFGYTSKIIEACGAIFIAGIGATFLTLMVEVPILNLEKILLKRPGRGVQEEKKKTDADGQDNPLVAVEEKINDPTDADLNNTVTNDERNVLTKKEATGDSVVEMKEI